MSQEEVIEVLREFREKECGRKIFVPLFILHKKVKTNLPTLRNNILKLEKRGEIESIDIVLGEKFRKYVKAVRLTKTL